MGYTSLYNQVKSQDCKNTLIDRDGHFTNSEIISCPFMGALWFMILDKTHTNTHTYTVIAIHIKIEKENYYRVLDNMGRTPLKEQQTDTWNQQMYTQFTPLVTPSQIYSSSTNIWLPIHPCMTEYRVKVLWNHLKGHLL